MTLSSLHNPSPLNGSTADITQVEVKAPAEHSIWTRISDSYQLSDVPRVFYEEQLTRFLKNKHGIVKILNNGRPYFHHIVEQIERRNLPMELALIPAIESAFKPRARSTQQAAGLWQFRPRTGDYLGLKQNWWVDMRLDVIASTDSALTYLVALTKQFDGNWSQGIVAYNLGPGALRRHLKRINTAESPIYEWHQGLPKETRHYLPKLLALAEIIRNPSQYGIKLPDIPNQAVIQVVNISGQIDVSLASELSGLSLSKFTDLNPAIKRWATDPEGPHAIVLPIEHVESFSAKLRSIDRSNHTTWLRHKIKTGETLSHLAVKYNTTTQVIRKSNKMKDDRIRSGRFLLVPQNKTFGTQTIFGCRGKKVIHTVQSGDTLWDLSKTYNTSITRIKNCNLFARNSYLKPKQKLAIWVN